MPCNQLVVAQVESLDLFRNESGAPISQIPFQGDFGLLETIEVIDDDDPGYCMERVSSW